MKNTIQDSTVHHQAPDNTASDNTAIDDTAFYDRAFRELIESPELRPLASAGDTEELNRYVRRIAGSVFCGAGIDPSVVHFATFRAAQQWRRDENEVDVMVGNRLLRTTAALITELQ